MVQDGTGQSRSKGEILIVDSSSDEMPQLALARGARVRRTLPLGLGHAYIDAIPYIRGKYVLIGDCRLHLRFTRDFGFCRKVPGRLRVCDGFAFQDIYRTQGNAGASPLFRYAADYLDSGFS